MLTLMEVAQQRIKIILQHPNIKDPFTVSGWQQAWQLLVICLRLRLSAHLQTNARLELLWSRLLSLLSSFLHATTVRRQNSSIVKTSGYHLCLSDRILHWKLIHHGNHECSSGWKVTHSHFFNQLRHFGHVLSYSLLPGSRRAGTSEQGSEEMQAIHNSFGNGKHCTKQPCELKNVQKAKIIRIALRRLQCACERNMERRNMLPWKVSGPGGLSSSHLQLHATLPKFSALLAAAAWRSLHHAHAIVPFGVWRCLQWCRMTQRCYAG